MILVVVSWNRTVARYQEGLLDAMREGDPVDAAQLGLRWCAAHPAEAGLPLAGRAALAPGEWPPTAIEEREAARARLTEALAEVAQRQGVPLTRVVFAHPAWERLALEAVASLLGAGEGRSRQDAGLGPTA